MYIVAFIITKAAIWGIHMDFSGEMPSRLR